MAIDDVSDQPNEALVSLAGRTAVVTGAAQGLGKAIVRRLAGAGAYVVLADRDEPGVQAAAADLERDYPGKVTSTRVDVVDAASVSAAADLAVERAGGLDIWVNNAGVFPRTPFLEVDEAVWDQVIDVNLKGVFLGAREGAKRMIAAGRRGVIVNIVSTAGFQASGTGLTAYVASKHGVRGVTRQLALELAPHDIRVLGVAPTYVATEGVANAVGAPSVEELRANPTYMTLLGRAGVADDIARIVLFCASDLSLFMTGSTLLADAGSTA